MTMAGGGSELLGEGASVIVRTVRGGLQGYGFRVPLAAGGLLDTGGGGMFALREVSLLAGTGEVLASALSERAAELEWSGGYRCDPHR